MMDIISQIMIFVLGVGAVFVCGLKNKNIAKWGFVMGVVSQPFWFYTVILHEQYIVLLAAIFYTISWANGLKNNFWNK